ncbi:MAG: hypothetical protein NVS1B4_10430 [Gemmatimonadaceae bacterium]
MLIAGEDTVTPVAGSPARSGAAAALLGAHDSPPIVGIGASAGGLDAFTRLLQHVPPKSGLAYVLVQHLDPTHESALPAILGRASRIPVIQAADGMRIKADHVYVIPPNTTLTVTDGHLRLLPRKAGRGLHLPIDAFLCSLAETHGSGALGVILSGTGTDGTIGIEAIKEAGGITMAQDEATTRYPSMPRSAVATGAVDFVLTPEEMAEPLARLGRQIARLPTSEVAVGSAPGDEDGDLRKILLLLRNRTGVDFSHYRRGTVHRRILRRMVVHKRDTRKEYLAHLRLNPPELDALYDDLLIGVTSFFRDPEVFAALQAGAFAQIVKGHAADTPLRFWIAGCSSGEEAYSFAIALLEFLGDRAPDVPIQIFGTDLSESAIAKARTGVYPEGIASRVSPERLSRFFVREEGGYRIAKAVRDLCVFSRHNLVRDPPFAHLDLISCRNVLIYLEPELQRRVFPSFHYALEPNGLLVLGSAETPGAASELFSPFAKKHRIYRRRGAARRPLDLDLGKAARSGNGAATRPTPDRSLALTREPDDLKEEANRIALAHFTPAGVVVDESMQIVQFRGDTSAFLSHAPGVASLDLLRLARAEFVIALRTAIHRAKTENRAIRETPVTLGRGSSLRHVVVEVIPFKVSSMRALYFLVSFVNAERDTASAVPGTKKATASPARPGRGHSRDAAALQHDLAAARRQLQSTIEEHEATYEELRALNEESQSSNEELQSTNEELETTKEEVQSTNEELTTVNEELRHRNRELAELSGDLTNILAGTTIPIVIVGRDLRIRRFTPATSHVMRLVATDAGRPLGDIKCRVPLPDLERQVENAIATLAVTEQEVRDEDGRWWSLTIRPYQTIDRLVDGAVLVFSDIDATKRAGESARNAAEERLRLLGISETARGIADRERAIAQDANQAKGTFLASMSHDLRTPLNAIAGYTELLEMGLRGPVTDEQVSDLSRIKQNARHLLSLINDILNFAKVESGQLEMHLKDVSFRRLVDDLEAVIRPQCAARSLRFESGDGDAILRADPERLRQVLVNLVSNAVKFTNPGGRLGARCSTVQGMVKIEIWDTGVGIAENQIGRIFEPFVQVTRGLSSPSNDGVGLGLAISRHLARAMHGELSVRSTIGKGSTFTLTIPRGDTSVQAAD